MRRLGFVVLSMAVLAPLGLTSAAMADDCSKDVLAAFEKQRTSKAFRMAWTQPNAEGVAEMTVDYLPPNKMMQTVKSPAMAGVQQTLLIGDRAFAGSGGAFEELLPQYTQSIVAEVESTLGKPTNVGNFECVGKASLDGKDYVAYRAADKDVKPGTDPGDVLARTVYVDSASGLPAYNVVAAVSGKGDPVMKVTYSYPTDVVIEAPQGAPMQKQR
jgi:hypothetical protein